MSSIRIMMSTILNDDGFVTGKLEENHQIESDNLIQPFYSECWRVAMSGVSIWDFPAGNMTFLESIKWIGRSFQQLFKAAKQRNCSFKMI
ncbi:MAG: hypothetical protein IPI62_14545 [Bacteroidetes bacterium]|nr:hypothetical protein [Bacteroidota bacterium]